jgi:thioesterase domain-containing protein
VDAGPFHRPLVRRLGSDQPVFGVALPELSALPKRLTVNDVAANLVEALCASPVDGPYHLAGWSQAGVIAYEMAQQLRTRGKEVGMVILLDANSPDYLRSFRGWKNALVRGYFWLEKVLYHLVKMRGLSWRGAWQYFRERRGRFDLKALEPGSDPSEEAPLDSWKVQYLAAADYHPAPCAWPLVLFRSEVLQTGRFRDPGLGWGQLARGGLQVYGMPGEHDAMFLEPDVERLASLIGECLATGNQR